MCRASQETAGDEGPSPEKSNGKEFQIGFQSASRLLKVIDALYIAYISLQNRELHRQGISLR